MKPCLSALIQTAQRDWRGDVLVPRPSQNLAGVSA